MAVFSGVLVWRYMVSALVGAVAGELGRVGAPIDSWGHDPHLGASCSDDSSAHVPACPDDGSLLFTFYRCLLPLLQSYAPQLGEDPIVHTHLSALYDTLLEQVSGSGPCASC